MKKLIGIIMANIILLSGCSASDLEAYKKAVLATEAYETGESVSKVSIDLSFDETGMSFEEIRDASYYEKIEVETSMVFDFQDNNKAVSDIYFNFGGLGFDMQYFIEDGHMLVRLPILDKFLDLENQFEQEADVDLSKDQARAIEKMIDAWNAVLSDEDVFSGSKAYVLTDKGQIKTTTFSIEIDADQFEILKENFLEILEDEALVEAFLANSDQFGEVDASTEEITESIRTLVHAMDLVTFTGKAFVDFDGRLVKQVLVCELVNNNTTSGQVKTMYIEYETSYDRLGEPVEITIPNVDEVDLLKLDEDGNIQDFFPEGLF